MIIIDGKIKLRGKRLSDARNDYLWQTDPELAELDATSLLTISFQQYLLDYTNELSRYSNPTRHLFAVETLDGKHIGNCVYYNINKAKGEAEVGVVIGDRNYWDEGYGTDAMAALVKHVFLKTNLKCLYLKTLDSNKRAQKCFKKCSFVPYGHMSRDGYNFVLMELSRERWEEK